MNGRMIGLMQYDPRSDTVDGLQFYIADVTALASGYKATGTEFPKTLSEKLKAAQRELTERLRSEKEIKRMRLQAFIEAHKPTETKVKDAQAELDALNKELGE